MIGRYNNKLINMMMNQSRRSTIAARSFSSQITTTEGAAVGTAATGKATEYKVTTAGDHVKSVWDIGQDA